MGRETLQRLVSYSLPTFRRKKNAYTASLSLYTDVVKRESESRDAGPSRSCLSSSGHGAYVGIRARLVDLCVRLMAGEATCHHSDHSMSRCLAYGAEASLVGNNRCWTYNDLFPGEVGSSGGGLNSGPEEKNAVDILKWTYPVMCGLMGGSVCDPRIHLTCHHHRPRALNDSYPVRFK